MLTHPPLAGIAAPPPEGVRAQACSHTPADSQLWESSHTQEFAAR
jgi:hypothetical protein